MAYDSIMDFQDYFKNHIIPDKIHNLNVSFIIDDMKLNYGGTAGNIAYNLKLLGESPLIISTAGKDFSKYRQWLSDNDINHSKIKIIDKEFTALAHIITDRGDNQITAFYPGSMKYSGGNIEKKFLKNAFAIVAPGCLEDVVNYPKVYKKNGVPYVYDPGQSITALSPSDLKNGIQNAEIFISNDYELSLVMKKTGWSEKEIAEKVKYVVTTLGEKGSLITARDKKFQIPPAKIKKICDPTGAGDAYRAGLIKGLVSGWPIEKAGRLGSVVSAYVVEAYGTQNHKFGWKDIKKRYHANYKEHI